MALSNLYAAKSEFKAAVASNDKLAEIRPTWIHLALSAVARTPYEINMKRSLERLVNVHSQLTEISSSSILSLNRATIKRWLSAHNPFTTVHNVHFAAWTGNLEAMERQVLRGGDVSLVDNDGWTALHLVVWNMHTHVIDLLLKIVHRNTVSAQNSEGSSALHLSMANDDNDTVRRLLRAGADPTSKDYNGMAPMHTGAWNGSVSAIKALKEVGADVSVKNNKGSTPMHYAASNGQVEAIKVLKEVGVDVSAKDNYGSTPMHYAATDGQVEAIEVLKGVGADVLARDNFRRTPMHVALQAGHDSAIEALNEHS